MPGTLHIKPLRGLEKQNKASMKCVGRRFYQKEEPFGYYNYYRKNPNIEEEQLNAYISYILLVIKSCH
jgi:hypothetical protein